MPLFDPNKQLYKEWGKNSMTLDLSELPSPFGAEDNPISPSASVRSAAVDAMKKTIDCCHASGVKLLAGPPLALGEFSGCGPTDDEIKWGRNNAASQPSTHPLPMSRLWLNTSIDLKTIFSTSVAQTVSFIGEVDHPNVRMMYDTFHANIEEKSNGCY